MTAPFISGRQRQLNACPHHATNHSHTTPRCCKGKRGRRNILTRYHRYLEWKTSRSAHRRLWRNIKSSGSEAMRKVIATSSPGVAIQEANWLYDYPEISSKANKKHDNRSKSSSTRNYFREYACKRDVIHAWNCQKSRAENRKIEKHIRKTCHKKWQNSAKPPVSEPDTLAHTNSLPYGQTFVIATLNCRGLNEAGKREQIMEIMHQHKIDLLALQETKINHSSEELKVFRNQKYLFRFSSSVNKKPKLQNHKSQKQKPKRTRKIMGQNTKNTMALVSWLAPSCRLH